jgi:hypothetical protein
MALAIVAPACSGTKFVGIAGDGGESQITAGEAGVGEADGGDAGSPGDAGSDAHADAAACFTGAIPSNVDRCTQDFDCTIVTEQIDCCGTVRYIGIATQQKNQFEKAENNIAQQCGCTGTCTPRPATAQDGRTVTEASRVQVQCTRLQCRTSVN